MTARYSVGIDLGTTNSVVAFAPLEGGDRRAAPPLELLPIPQWIGPGQIEARPSLPSFLYLPRESELESLRFPLVNDPEAGIAGSFSRAQAAENPQRVIVAAKSWLCHSRVGRRDAVLPWQSPPEVPKLSAPDCARRFLAHLAAAWGDAHPEAPLRDQSVVLTVPASFDPSARELTREAAVAAGLPEDLVLLEEPQAAVYRWLAAHNDDWRELLTVDDVLLVVDVGGGTTDLTLVTVADEGGDVHLRRLAVGNHLLLGGDNMDLALAHHVAARLAEEGHDLDPWQSVSLWHACREAKESLLADDGPAEQTVSILGRGSSLIGGTISTTLSREATRELILDGFFPKCGADARPQRQATSGFQEIGLPYESDPAITKQLAAFLSDQHAIDGGSSGVTGPTHLLFNGGVFHSEALRARVQDVIRGWTARPPQVLRGDDQVDAAVAYGAAYYGWSKHVGGLRIRGGTARSYYVGIETAGLAIPGAARPLRALCVASQGMEEGTESEVPGEQVGLVVGTPARFRFFSSTVRPDDVVGTQLSRWREPELVESQPMELTLPGDASADEPFVPVRFISRVTELGMFELWCHSTRGDERWKLEFSIRDR